MDQFPGNSKLPDRARAREEPPKKVVESVVQGKVTRRKTPIGRRLTQNLIGGDAQSVWGYMLGEIVIPYARDMIYEAFAGGLERAIFGTESGGRSRGRSRGGRTDYQSPFNRNRGSSRYDEPRREMSRRGRSMHSFDEIVLDSRIEAEEVLDRLEAMLDKYDSVTVADFYELCGVEATYTDQKYGWTNLASAKPQRIPGGGHLVRMPPPEPLD